MIKFSNSGIRLDQALAFEANISRSKAQEWIEAGVVLIDGKPVTKPAYKLRGEQVTAEPLPEVPMQVLAEDLPLEVLYDDPDMIVINKAAGMITHPAPGVFSGTLVNALMGRFGITLDETDTDSDTPTQPELVRPGIVHRLDKDTSGVIVIARHGAAHRRLSEAFANRTVFKRYIAITNGNTPTTMVSAPIGRHPVDRVRMHINGEGARFAQTDFETLEHNPESNLSLVSAILHTGRTHQIRVHLKHLSTPVLGDSVYGKPSSLIARQALHAYELRITHPRTGRYIEFKAPIPDDMQQAWPRDNWNL